MGQKKTWPNRWKGDAGLEAEAAVDSEDLAGDEVRAGGKEKDSGRDVVDSAVAPHRCLFGEVLVADADLTGSDDHAGSDAVDADVRRPCLGHGLREHVQRGLRGAVVSVGGPGMNAAERADIDDATAGAFEVLVGIPGHEEGSTGVGGEHL